MKQADQLWSGRLASYRNNNLRYWKDVFRSGFGTFLLLGLIVLFYFYRKWLDVLPVTYPYEWIALAVLIPILVISPVRTLLKEADRVFLLRLEGELGGYFRKALLRSIVIQLVWVGVPVLVLWPLIQHCSGAGTPYLVTLLVSVFLIKVSNLAGSWYEDKLQYAVYRTVHSLFRLAATALITYMLLVTSWPVACLLLLCGLAASALYMQVTPRFPVNWEQLIHQEKDQQARLYSFFSFFTDVPALSYRVKRRSALAWLADSVPFTQQDAFFFLYSKSFIRSELFGILSRITLIGALLLISSVSDTGRVLFFLGTLGISALQISGVEQLHRYSFWLELYPLAGRTRVRAVVRIIFRALVVQLIVLTALLLVFAGMQWIWLPAVCLALIAWYSFRIVPRKFDSLLEA